MTIIFGRLLKDELFKNFFKFLICDISIIFLLSLGEIKKKFGCKFFDNCLNVLLSEFILYNLVSYLVSSCSDKIKFTK